ncbi:MAG: hypothetical protein A2Z70_01400 [Chloroflexi bacterium RBG_13_48_17]|nr:MAG: hypothetical protein A2Z70_01400 [Chloroflexi bacterium RBG_13_48_17]
MNILDHLEQVEQETGIDISELSVVAEPGGRRVLRKISDGTALLYIVIDHLSQDIIIKVIIP